MSANLNGMKKSELIELVKQLQAAQVAEPVHGSVPVATYFNRSDAFSLRNRIAEQRKARGVARTCFVKPVIVSRSGVFNKRQTTYEVVA